MSEKREMKLGDTRRHVIKRDYRTMVLAQDKKTIIDARDYHYCLVEVQELKNYTVDGGSYANWCHLHWDIPTTEEIAGRMNYIERWFYLRRLRKQLPVAKVVA